MKSSALKLVSQYDANRNEYTVFRHNLTTEAAQQALQELSARLFSLFVIDQHGIHPNDDPEACEACRREVERTSRVHPKPTFRKRRPS